MSSLSLTGARQMDQTADNSSTFLVGWLRSVDQQLITHPPQILQQTESDASSTDDSAVCVRQKISLIPQAKLNYFLTSVYM